MLLLATLRTQARRFVATGLAVVLGVAFIAATLVLSGSLSSGVLSTLTGDLRGYAAVVTPTADGGSVPASALTAARAVEGVRSVRPVTTGEVMIGSQDGGSYAVATSLPSATSAARLDSGRYPRIDAEVALSSAAASTTGLHLGATVMVSGVDGPSTQHTATVVGIVDAAPDPRYSAETVVFATDPAVAAWTGRTAYDELDVVAAQGASPDVVRAGVARAVGHGLTVRTGTDQAIHMVKTLGGATKALTAFMLAFAAIAVFVSAIVVANTFVILLARRARETALLRCVGSTRGQVVRQSFAEALALGIGFSAAGVGLGAAMAGGLVALANRAEGLGVPHMTYAVTARDVLVPLLCGVVVMVLASVWPVVRASRVRPLEALRPAPAVQTGNRAGRLRLAFGFLLLVAGSGSMAVGVTVGLLPAGVLGGMLSFLGVLLLGPLLVPALTRLVGRLAARATGVPGELAVDNAVRNPGRAAATASALVVGVALITMTVVGGASAQATADAALNSQFSVDAGVSAQASTLPATAAARLGAVDGVAATATLAGARLTVAGARDQLVMGLPAAARPVLRNPDVLADLTPHTLVVAKRDAARHLTDGGRAQLTGPGGTVELTVRVDGRTGFDYAVPAADLAAVAPDAPVHAVLLRFQDSADAGAVLDDVRAVARTFGQVEVGGAAPERAQFQSALALVVRIVAALLAISVLIAVVGVANTLSLSVLERRKESALLRALGTTRGQLRAMLAIEGVLLALVGSVIGVGLGVAYGLLGTATLLEAAGESLHADIAYGTIGLIVGGAVVAGLLASVLPSRQATRISPAAALAVE